MPSAPSAPDPNLIAQLANYFFRTPPDGPIPTRDSPGMPLVPPSPNMVPAPSVVTSAAPLIPAALPFGPPDFPPTTIASVVPTPNISAPTTPAAPHGLPDVPQPGSTAGGFAPNAPGDLDAAGPLAHLAEFTSFVPKEHLASAFGAQDLTPSPFNTPPKDSPYFLDDNALARRDLDLAAVPAAPTPSVSPSLPDTAPAARLPDAPGISPQIPQGADASIPSARPAAPELPQSFGWPSAAAPQTPQAPVNIPHVPDSPGVPDAHVPGEAFYFLGPAKSAAATETTPQNGATAPAAPAQAPASFSPQIVALETAPAAVDLGSSTRPFDPYTVKRDFPILQEKVHGKPLVWLDNAATTQKPQSVIDRISYFYEHENSNIHRAAHDLAARATDAYEVARQKTARFLNAGSERDIIFVRGATEGINLVAKAWGGRNVKEGDEIVITWLEHHANIVPWQQLCGATGAKLRVAPVDNTGQVILEEYERLLGPRTRIVAMPQVSNALGTIVPVQEMTAIAHRYGACVLVDGAQSVSHMPVDVQTIDCDFFVFSGHKVFGPTGIGVVYGKPDVLAHMPPWQGGGNMIADVTFEKTIYQPPPNRFEAGTGNIADAVGLGAAIDYVESIGREIIDRYEHELLVYATEKMLTVPGLTMIGTAKDKASVLSFVLDGCRSEDVGKALNQEGIAVRAGHHCAQPILRRFGVETTVRPSLAFYNTKDDVDLLVATLHRIQAGRVKR
ncbi:segregation protein B [Methylovirgula ligni]|uniref:Cysteine desulfurase n=1 Tax=Methylovirgula ligni TaxID=569860 RepID=A0A3D9YQR1_9HYPH|nr:family 2A encapsulin nanocompartment cargo protein cysteine desulfurase [Methylovirgula ligni]QAY96761.1 segregation protein B [Methylovirgula ligni]REF83192.1 cysteine desulfurase/selenocysteine lyase [Methylovirgula ligni]